MLATRQPGTAARTSRTVRAASPSPASTTVSAVTWTVSSARSCPRAEGTALSRLAVQGAERSARASRSLTISTQPPDSSGLKISKTDTSKFSEVEATTWDRPRPPNSAAAQSARDTTEPWVATTPLGRPVDPEVWMT